MTCNARFVSCMYAGVAHFRVIIDPEASVISLTPERLSPFHAACRCGVDLWRWLYRFYFFVRIYWNVFGMTKSETLFFCFFCWTLNKNVYSKVTSLAWKVCGVVCIPSRSYSYSYALARSRTCTIREHNLLGHVAARSVSVEPTTISTLSLHSNYF